MLDPIVLSYAAGFVDGEGTIGIWREVRKENISGYRFKPEFEVSNTDRRVIDWFVEMFGGFVTHPNRKRMREQNQKALYKWRATRSEIPKLLSQIAPYLKLKKEQAELVFEFEKVKDKYDLRPGKRQDPKAMVEFEKLWQMTKALNKRGI